MHGVPSIICSIMIINNRDMCMYQYDQVLFDQCQCPNASVTPRPLVECQSVYKLRQPHVTHTHLWKCATGQCHCLSCPPPSIMKCQSVYINSRLLQQSQQAPGIWPRCFGPALFPKGERGCLPACSLFPSRSIWSRAGRPFRLDDLPQQGGWREEGQIPAPRPSLNPGYRPDENAIFPGQSFL